MDFFSVLSHLDWSQVGQLTLQHLLLVLVAVGLAILVGVPLGVLMTRFTWLAGSLQGAATVMLTIPSIALFGLLMPVYSVFGQGLGPLPAITAVVMNIGVMTIAAVIGAGGLGVLILTSISQSNMPMLVVGAVLVSLLAIVADLLLQWLQRILTPKGLRASAH
ncbi:ABC transporter permease [Pseudomonas aeruginosa]